MQHSLRNVKLIAVLAPPARSVSHISGTEMPERPLSSRLVDWVLEKPNISGACRHRQFPRAPAGGKT